MRGVHQIPVDPPSQCLPIPRLTIVHVVVTSSLISTGVQLFLTSHQLQDTLKTTNRPIPTARPPGPSECTLCGQSISIQTASASSVRDWQARPMIKVSDKKTARITFCTLALWPSHCLKAFMGPANFHACTMCKLHLCVRQVRFVCQSGSHSDRHITNVPSIKNSFTSTIKSPVPMRPRNRTIQSAKEVPLFCANLHRTCDKHTHEKHECDHRTTLGRICNITHVTLCFVTHYPT